jgi:hypothetical protein
MSTTNAASANSEADHGKIRGNNPFFFHIRRIKPAGIDTDMASWIQNDDVATCSNQDQGIIDSDFYGIKESLPRDREQALEGGLKLAPAAILMVCVIATYVVCVVVSFS